jgi:hypothetical protein
MASATASDGAAQRTDKAQTSSTQPSGLKHQLDPGIHQDSTAFKIEGLIPFPPLIGRLDTFARTGSHLTA